MTLDENVMYKDKDKKGSGRTKQVGVEVELQNNQKMSCTRTKTRKVLGEQSKWELRLSYRIIHIVSL